LPFINAWLLAKVMLTVEIFHVGDSLKHKPLIYPIVLKSAVFAIMLISFHILEEVLLGVWHGKTISAFAATAQGPEIDPTELLRNRTDALAQRAVELKNLANAWQPLYQSLNPDQKIRMQRSCSAGWT
jgi:hypothetical protein